MGGFERIMIHHNFLDNWKKILEYNKKLIQEEKLPEELRKIRIPLTSIEIKPDLLTYIFEIFYPKYINDQQNVVDIIVSNNEDELLKIILYKTDKAGVHTSYESLEPDIVKLKKYPIEEVGEFFNKLQSEIFDEYKIRVSHMRVFKKQAIDLLNEYLENIENISFDTAILKILNIIEKLFENHLFFIYPKPTIMNFFEELLKVSQKKTFISDTLEFVKDILPKFNIAIIISAPESSFIVKIINDGANDSKYKLNLHILSTEGFNIDYDTLNEEEILKSLFLELDVEYIFHIEQKHIIKMLTDLFELQYPIDFGKIKLLFEKLLYGFRTYQTHWFKYPKPLTYKPLLRWFIRLFGISFNLKKLSHWEIPEFFFSLFNMNFGLKNRIILIFTDLNQHKDVNIKKIENPIELGFTQAILIGTDDRKLINIIPISKKVKKVKNLDLREIRKKLMEDYGYIDLILSIDKSLLSEIVDNFILKFNNFNIISKIKTIKKLKKEYYMNVYPETPEFRFIKNSGTISFITTILPILIDKHLF